MGTLPASLMVRPRHETEIEMTQTFPRGLHVGRCGHWPRNVETWAKNQETSDPINLRCNLYRRVDSIATGSRTAIGGYAINYEEFETLSP